MAISHKFLVVNSQCARLLGRDVCSKLNIIVSVPCSNNVYNVPDSQHSVLKKFEQYLADDYQSEVTQTVSLKVNMLRSLMWVTLYSLST